MSLRSCQYQIIQVSYRANLRNCECLDGEEAADDKDSEGVEIISQEPVKVNNDGCTRR